MKSIKHIVGPLYRFLRELWRLNILATLYINLRKLPLRQGLKFPVLCYGKIKFISLRGRIVFDAPISTGMVKIGYRWIDLWPTSFLPTQLNIIGTLHFNGSIIISGGASINAQSNDSVLEVGGNKSVIGSGTVLKSMNHIFIGSATRITGNCVIMDSNMHFIKNIENGRVQRNNGKIIIGSHCWINAGSIITKGSVLPDYTITARNTFISKDFSDEGSFCFLAGSPARILRRNIYRIYNHSVEESLNKIFNKDSSIEYVTLQSGVELTDL